jgi:hypothetical protein
MGPNEETDSGATFEADVDNIYGEVEVEVEPEPAVEPETAPETDECSGSES